MSLRNLRPSIVFWILCVGGFFVYARTLFFPFVHDDVVFIQSNMSIARWDNILDSFIHPSGALVVGQMSYYRPLLEVYNRLVVWLFGLSPMGFHALNVLFHVAVAFLVYVVARQLRLGAYVSFVAAFIFLVHPVQTEAVSCVSGISNLLSAFFMLSALCVHIKSRRAGQCISWAAIVLSVLGFFVKEQAVMAVFLVGLYEVLFRQESLRARARVLAPWGVAVVLFLAWRVYLFPGFSTSFLADGHELKLRLLALPAILLTYLKLVFWPTDLHYFRSLDILSPHPYAWGVLAVIILSVVWWWRKADRRVRRGVLFGLGFFLITLLPVLNIAPLINEYSWVMVAEHFLYLPLIGLLVALGACLRLTHRRMDDKWVVLWVGIACLFCVMTFYQTRVWRHEVPLFERASVYEPSLGRVKLLLAGAYTKEGRFKDAEAASTEALRIMENYVKRTSPASVSRRYYEVFVKAAHHERALARLYLGDLTGAREDYMQVIVLVRQGITSRLFGGNDGEALRNLGVMWLEGNDRKKAARAFEEALIVDAHDALAMNNLGMMALERLDRVSARFWLSRAIKLSPENRQIVENYNKVK